MIEAVKIISGIVFLMIVSFAFMSFKISGGRIKVYLQNKCSSDISLRIESPDSANNYTVEDGVSKLDTFLDGTKTFDSKGLVVHIVTTSTEEKNSIVCE